MCGRSQAKVRGTVARPERTGPTFGCGSGSESLGVRRGRQGRPRFRRVCLDNLAGAEGVEETRPQAGRFESPPGRRRTQESSGDRAALGGGSGLAGRACNPRRPRIAVAMDLQESSRPGQPAPGNGPCHQLSNRRDVVAPGGIQSSSKSESQRRSAASGPQRPIRTHLPRGAPATVGRATGDLGGHQEEGAGRGLQEPRARVASAGNAAAGAGARLPHPRERQGDSVRRVRLDEKHRMGKHWHRPRHGGVCGQQHSAVVAHDGASGVSAGSRAADHGGFRRQQRRADPAVEVGAPEVGHGERPVHFRVPSPTGNEQVEQDRAPIVFVHQPELARSALGQPGDNHQPDRGDTDAGRPEGSLRTRPRALPPGREDYGRPDVQPEYRAGTIPWRLELHDSSQTTPPQMNQLFLNEP